MKRLMDFLAAAVNSPRIGVPFFKPCPGELYADLSHLLWRRHRDMLLTVSSMLEGRERESFNRAGRWSFEDMRGVFIEGEVDSCPLNFDFDFLHLCVEARFDDTYEFLVALLTPEELRDLKYRLVNGRDNGRDAPLSKRYKAAFRLMRAELLFQAVMKERGQTIE